MMFADGRVTTPRGRTFVRLPTTASHWGEEGAGVYTSHLRTSDVVHILIGEHGDRFNLLGNDPDHLRAVIQRERILRDDLVRGYNRLKERGALLDDDILERDKEVIALNSQLTAATEQAKAFVGHIRELHQTVEGLETRIRDDEKLRRELRALDTGNILELRTARDLAVQDALRYRKIRRDLANYSLHVGQAPNGDPIYRIPERVFIADGTVMSSRQPMLGFDAYVDALPDPETT